MVHLGFSFTMILVIPVPCLLRWRPHFLGSNNLFSRLPPLFWWSASFSSFLRERMRHYFFWKLCISENVWFSCHTCCVLVVWVWNSRQETIFFWRHYFPDFRFPGWITLMTLIAAFLECILWNLFLNLWKPLRTPFCPSFLKFHGEV